MSTETLLKRPSERFHRLYGSHPESGSTLPFVNWRTLAMVVIAVGFVGLGGGIELTDDEAKVAMTAYESVGPYAQVMGEYDASVAPASAWLAKLSATILGGPSSASMRLPSMLAALGIVWILMRRVAALFGPRAGTFTMLACCGSVAMIDRTSMTGFDFPLGLAMIATLDRILNHKTDWTAGALAAVTVLFGGWPALAAILLPLIVIGRRGSTPTFRLMIPPLLAFVAWSIWALFTTRAVIWAAAITLPVTKPMAWSMGLWTLAFALPWLPFAGLSLMPSLRDSQGEAGKSLLIDWWKVGVVSLLAGTLLPGLAGPCSLLVFAAILVSCAVALDAAWSGGLSRKAGIIALVLSLTIGLVACGFTVYAGAYLAVSQPYYRVVGIVMIGLGVCAGLLALDSTWMRSTRGAVRTLLVVAITIKVVYSGFYAPERDYRFGKGPWGRAVGQYVPPNWPIYTFHPISPSLAFATEHPVHRLRDEIFLTAVPTNGPRFILLQESEFDHWPETAPKIQKVRAFEDEYGGIRVLARTEGPLQRREIDN